MPIQKYFGQIGVASGPNYPGYFTNGVFSSSVTANGIVNTGTVSGNQVVVNPATVATLVLTAAQSGNIFTLSAASASTAQIVILPTPQVGLSFDFDVTAAATASYTYKIYTGTASIFFQGIDQKMVTGTLTGANFFDATGGTSTYYDMNGTTLGGLIGSTVKVVCLSSSLWQLQAASFGSGSLGNSFATS